MNQSNSNCSNGQQYSDNIMLNYWKLGKQLTNTSVNQSVALSVPKQAANGCLVAKKCSTFESVA